jgi:hypothetical protein
VAPKATIAPRPIFVSECMAYPPRFQTNRLKKHIANK